MRQTENEYKCTDKWQKPACDLHVYRKRAHIKRVIVGSRAHSNLTNVSQQSITLCQFTLTVDLNAYNNMHSISGIALTNAQHVCMGDLMMVLVHRVCWEGLQGSWPWLWATAKYWMNRHRMDQTMWQQSMPLEQFKYPWGKSLGIPPTELKVYCIDKQGIWLQMFMKINVANLKIILGGSDSKSLTTCPEWVAPFYSVKAHIFSEHFNGHPWWKGPVQTEWPVFWHKGQPGAFLVVLLLEGDDVQRISSQRRLIVLL